MPGRMNCERGDWDDGVNDAAKGGAFFLKKTGHINKLNQVMFWWCLKLVMKKTVKW